MHSMYSLWTSPPDVWDSPIVAPIAVAEVLQVDATRAEEDEQVRAFRTPITHATLHQIVRVRGGHDGR